RDVGPLAVATLGAQGDDDVETAAEVAEEFDEDDVSVVLDGGRCTGRASTVVDATGEDLHLIREGRLPWAAILEAAGGQGCFGGGRRAARSSSAPEAGDAAARLAASSSRKTSSRWTDTDRGASIPMRTWSPRTSRTVTTTSEPIMMLWLARRVRTSNGAPSVELSG